MAARKAAAAGKTDSSAKTDSKVKIDAKTTARPAAARPDTKSAAKPDTKSAAKPAVKADAVKTDAVKTDAVKTDAVNEPGTMAEHPEFVNAVVSYLRAGSNFQSSLAFATLTTDLMGAQTLNDVFLLPIRHKMVSMQGAIEFAYFLYYAETKVPLVEGEPAFTEQQKLDISRAFADITGVYDDGVHDEFLPHLDDEDEDDDEDADEEGADEEGADEEGAEEEAAE